MNATLAAPQPATCLVSLLEPGMPLLCYARRPISQTAYYSDREEGERHVAE